MSFKNGPLINIREKFSPIQVVRMGECLCWGDSAVLGQAPISTATLQKLHKSLAKSAENLGDLETVGEREKE